MPTMHWKGLVGQQRVKATLGAALENGSLGHAYLFCGDSGVGKLQAAVELGLALLCTRSDSVPCYTCDACRKVRNHAHPDFQLVLPLSLQKEHRSSDGKLSEAGWAHLDKECKRRINDPYAAAEFDSLPTVPVEWIREVNHSIVRGSVKDRRNVAIICGVDLLNKESANAMLKTLEEPPDNTIIILTSDRPHAVLPTVVSRCQIIRFGYVGDDAMCDSLAATFGFARDDSRILNAVRCSEGSLGTARRLMEQPLDELLADARELLELCASDDWEQVAPRLETLVGEKLDFGRNYGFSERILTYLVYLVRDSFLKGLGVTEKYIRNEFTTEVLTEGALDTSAAGRVLGLCQEAITSVRARGNVQLVLVTFLMSMMETIHGKK